MNNRMPSSKNALVTLFALIAVASSAICIRILSNQVALSARNPNRALMFTPLSARVNSNTNLLYIALGVIAVLIAIIIWLLISKSRDAKLTRRDDDIIAHVEKSSRDNSAFLSRLSHEIRTPMNSIIGLTTLAHQSIGDSEKVDDCISKIEFSTKTLNKILNDILEMSAADNRKFSISNSQFDFKRWFYNLSAICCDMCSGKNIHYQVTLNNVRCERLVGDCSRLDQIVLNLITNAVNNTKCDGNVTINIAQSELADGRVMMRFTITDTGTGISPDMQRHLFRPITHSDGTTGYGLTIVKSLTELMGGKISCTSEPEKGTSFTVELPFVVQKGMTPNAHGFSGTRVLVCDNGGAVCEYLCHAFSAHGAGCVVCSDPGFILETLKQGESTGGKYDLCLINRFDDNFTEIKRIREQYPKGSLYIALGTYDLFSVRDEAIKAGIDSIVTLPLFNSVARDLLSRQAGGQPSVHSPHYNFDGVTVLVAEDNDINRKVTCQLLGQSGIKTLEAKNGKEVAEIFECSNEHDISVILMDIQMPVVDGLSAAKSIRASSHPNAKYIPIIAMTANAFAEDIALSRQAGMNGHITKPLDPEYLFNVLAGCLGIAE